MQYIIGFLVGTIICALFLYLWVRVAKLHGTIFSMLLIGAICSLVSYIPGVGRLVSLIAMCVLLYKLTDADKIWPGLVIVAVATQISMIVAVFAAAALIAACM